MKKWLSQWLKKRGHHRMIYRERDGQREDYLERFYLISTPFLGVYLHRFWASDDDGLHDHPWHSVSILLDGGYYEEEPERQCVPHGPTVVRFRSPLHPILKVRSKYHAHRITVPDGTEGQTWSLFIRFGLKRRKWGFYRYGTWQPSIVQSRKEEQNV